jgi:hypothetical protein
MLQNPFYNGVLIYKGKAYPGKHEPLISQETFERVRSALAAHERNADYSRKREFLLRGFVHCAICGCRYTAEVHPDKGKAYYHCTLTNRTLQHSNRGQNVGVEDLESQVEELFRRITLPEPFVQKILERARAILKKTHEGLDEERRLLRLRQEKLEEQRDVLEQKLIGGVIADDVYQRNHARVEDEIQELRERIWELEGDRSGNIEVFERLLFLARDVHKAYHDAPYALKRQYLSVFWERIEAQDGLIVRAIPTQAFGLLFQNSDLSDERVLLKSNWGPSSQMDITKLLRSNSYWKGLAEKIAKLGREAGLSIF